MPGRARSGGRGVCENRAVLRVGTGEPLVLFHGLLGSERMWQDVVPLLASDYEVIAPTAYGHHGGEAVNQRPGRYGDVVAAAERQLDALGIERAHLVGNSMGGWMALDLARRGRALSAIAISPAGMWPPVEPGATRPAATKLRQALERGRAARPLLPFLYRIPAVRQYGFQNVIAHGRRLSPAMALALTDDMLGCAIAEDMLRTDEHFAPLDPAPCPITIAWAQWDRIFRERDFGQAAQERVPGARYVVLPKVGHVPMLDDPQLVADAIREHVHPTAPATQRPVLSHVPDAPLGHEHSPT
jgi:pimeloyl-ACP methyl ester carboxylesterase